MDSATRTPSLEEKINELLREERYDDALVLAKTLDIESQKILIQKILRLFILFRLRKVDMTEKEFEEIVKSKDPLEKMKAVGRIGSAFERDMNFIKKQRDRWKDDDSKIGKEITKAANTIILANIVSKSLNEQREFDRKIAEEKITKDDVQLFRNIATDLSKDKDSISEKKDTTVKRFADDLNKAGDDQNTDVLIDLLDKEMKKEK